MAIINNFPSGRMIPVSQCFYIGNSCLACMVWADSLKLGMKKIKDQDDSSYNAVGFDDRSADNTGTYFVKVLSANASYGSTFKLLLGYSYNVALSIDVADLIAGNIYRVDFVKEGNIYSFSVYSPDGTLLGSAYAQDGSGNNYIAKIYFRSH